MTAATPFLLSKSSQEGLVHYAQLAASAMTDAGQIRQGLIYSDYAYMRENDRTRDAVRARIANKFGDKEKIQNVIVPVVMPQIESSVATLSKIFLSTNPIFEFSSSPEQEQTALQYNSIMMENQQRGGWVRELMMFFRDGLKYNIHALEVAWTKKQIWAVESDPVYKAGIEGKAKTVLWEGNKIRRMDMYNTFFDTRVAPADIHRRGEFAGYIDLYSRVELKRFIAELPDKFIDNINAAFDSGSGGGDSPGSTSFYLPQLNPEAIFQKSPQQTFDWMAWVNNKQTDAKVSYKNSYEVSVVYARIIPADFNISVPARKTPQVWKLIIVNHTVLIYAERQTNAHDFLPMVFGQPLEDGLRYQTKSFGKNLEPFQDMASALWNERLSSARRRITDRVLYNPALIRKEDINSPEPNAKIPVKNAAYGRKLEEAVYAFPFRDENSQYFTQEAQQIYNMSFLVSGKNNPSLGQFQKGNKNNPEWEQTMENANERDQQMARFMEDQVFTPVKEILKMNILQYQPSGDIYNSVDEQYVAIDPVELRKIALDFKIADGVNPTQKIMHSDDFTIAMQTIQSVPQIGQGFDIVPMFAYIMQLRGLDGLDKFQKSPLQIQYEQQLASWQQVASEAVKAGQQPPPQPQPSPQLIAELQAKQAKMQAAKQGTTQNTAPQPPNPQAVAAGSQLTGSPGPGIGENQNAP